MVGNGRHTVPFHKSVSIAIKEVDISPLIIVSVKYRNTLKLCCCVLGHRP